MKRVFSVTIIILALSSIAFAGPGDQAYSQAKALFDKRDFQGAIQAANGGLQLEPDNFSLNLLLGDIYFLQADFANALNYYRKASEKKGKDPDALYGAGMAAYKSGSFDEAQKFLLQGEKSGKQRPRFQYALGLVLLEKGDYTNADISLRKAIDKEKKNPLYHLALAEANYRNKIYSIAISEFKKAVELDSTIDRSTAKDLHYKMAQSHLQLRNIPMAIEEYKVDLKLFPTDSTAWMELSRIYEISGNNAEAVFCYEKYLEIAPGNGEAWFSLGRLNLAINNDDKAAEAFEKAVSLNTRVAESYGLLARIYTDRKLYDKAINAYNRYEAAFGAPDSTLYWFEKGKAMSKYGEKNAAYFDSAIVAFDKVLRLDSTFSSAYEYAGLTSYSMKNYNRAISYFQRKVALDSTSVNSYRNMAFCYLKLEQYAPAANAFEKALQLKPDDVMMRAMTGKLYTFAKVYGKAVDHFEYLLNHSSADLTDSLRCEVYPDLGLAYLSLRDCKSAIPALLKAEQCQADETVLLNLALSYQLCDKIKEANAYFKKVLAVNPNNKIAKRGLLETTIQGDE